MTTGYFEYTVEIKFGNENNTKQIENKYLNLLISKRKFCIIIMEFLDRILEEYGSDDDDAYASQLIFNQSTKNPVEQKTIQLLQNQLKNHLTNTCTANVSKLMNSMPGAEFCIPSTTNRMKNLVEPSIPYDIYIICSCDSLVKNNEKCEKCNVLAKKNSKANNFIVSFPLIPQIQLVLSARLNQVMQYLNRGHGCGVISDIDDGKAFKRIASKHENSKILSFTMNSDGAAIFGSSKGSLWLTQVYQNYLPPSIRYQKENVLITSLYYGVKKPNPFHLVSHLANELDDCSLDIFDGNQFINFVPAIVTASCDLPAKAMFQNFKGPVGKDSCSICHHPGVNVKNLKGTTTIRYLKQDHLRLRTHIETVQTASLVANGNSNAFDGIKGISCMLLFNDFDIVSNFAIDFMHGICLGVTKYTIEIWLGIKKIPDPKNGLKIKLKSAKEKICVNKRIQQLKPIMQFTRKPRPISDIALYKASELLHFLLYYYRFVLHDMLSTKVIKHFELLSSAVFILCQPPISKDEKNRACGMLVEFADQYQEIYGDATITMNVHLLRHYSANIDECGPIWSNSLFGFESNIGEIKRYVSGTTDVLTQIAEKYVLSKSIFECTDNKGDCPHEDIYVFKTINITEIYSTVFERHSIAIENNSIRIGCRLKLNGQTFTSLLSCETKSADFFLAMNDGTIGTAEFYFKSNGHCHVFLNIYEIDYVHHHLKEVKKSNFSRIYACNNIQNKLLYLKVNSIEYVSQQLRVFHN